MRSKEQHMKFIENQRKSMNTSRKNQWEPQKPMKNQRRNNEKQWKTMESQRQFCQHSKVTFCQRFLVPVFSRFSSSMGKERRDNFEGKKTVLRRLWDRGFIKPCKYAVNGTFGCICASNMVIFFFIAFRHPYGEKHAGLRELSMHFFYPKICTLYGNTVVSCSDALKLIMLTSFTNFHFWI